MFIQKICSLLTLSLLLITSCTKTNVDFATDGDSEDPDITYYDNYPVNLSSYQLDSFITSGHSTFSIGYHRDAFFGNLEAAGYAGLLLPDENPVKSQSVIFDSLVLVLHPNGSYYGDSSLPVTFQVNELIQPVSNDNEDTRYYNARTFPYNNTPLGTRTVTVRPGRDSLVRIRLSDALGQDLLQKLRVNATAVQSQSEFVKYIKGFRIGVDSSLTNTMYYFSIPADSTLVQLHYRLNGTTYQEKTLNFKVNSSLQYNYILPDRQFSPLSVFTQFKKQLKASALTAHKAFLHTNSGTMIKIGIPDLLSLKELHPYVKVMKAELIVRPAPGTYNYPYSLPSTLSLYSTDDGNGLNEQLTDGTYALTGNLNVDLLYGENTYYSFDITSFITSAISEGEFSKAAIMMTPASGTTETTLERLVINDQTLNKGIQLKLHVLGL